MSLKDLRLRERMTQQELAAMLEVDQSAVSHWERGDVPLPKYRKKLCKIFSCKDEDLLATPVKTGKEV